MRATHCFATEARVRGWRRVGSYVRGWVVYDVCITTRRVRVNEGTLTQKGIVCRTYKRYNAFRELRRQLLDEAPLHSAQLPPLPAASVGMWHKYMPAFLEERRRGLQQWLRTTLLDPRWGGTHAYARWVLEK
ncbi:hypothetical protein MSPP1_000029 [Malassezia sp. CBS 17886]|nr:hypothetical protein MSPP1_000029 [Malassezia sp. CBS 17886]